MDRLFDVEAESPNRKTWYHASSEPTLEPRTVKDGREQEFHAGTWQAAVDRAMIADGPRRKFLHQVTTNASMADAPVVADSEDWDGPVVAPSRLQKYDNIVEDPGSVSVAGALSRDFGRQGMTPFSAVAVTDYGDEVKFRRNTDRQDSPGLLQSRLFNPHDQDTGLPGKIRHRGNYAGGKVPGWDRS